MNKIIIAGLIGIFGGASFTASAQDDKKKEDKKETQIITIKKSGEKNADIKIEFKGESVLINGKPLVEFKDDAITINNKKIVVKEGNRLSIMGDDGKAAMEMDLDGIAGWGERFAREFAFSGSRTFLGVVTADDEAGAKITEITKESAAEKAGLKAGDIITKVGDTKIEDPSDLSDAIANKKPKEEVKISFKRDGKEKSVKATLQERKDIESRSLSFSSPRGGMRTLTVPGYPATPGAPRSLYRSEGLNFDEFVVTGRPKLGLKIQDLEEGSGVKVLEVEAGSAAEKAGLKKDDVIVSVGAAKVENTDDAREELHKNVDKSSYSIEATRNGSPMKFDIRIPKKLKTANL